MSRRVMVPNLGPCPVCREVMDYGDLAPGAGQASEAARIREADGEGVICDVCCGHVDPDSNAELAAIRGTTTAAITTAARRASR